MFQRPVIQHDNPATDEPYVNRTRVCRVRRASRSTLTILVLLNLVLFISQPACVRTSVDLAICNPGASDETWIGPDLESMHTRIEFLGHPSFQAGTFWLRECQQQAQQCPDALTVKWDSFTVLWKLHRDHGCDFDHVPENQNNEHCERCNYCNEPTHCHFSMLTQAEPGIVGPEVVRFEGFVVDDSAEPASVESFHLNSGCPNPVVAANRFTPTGMATYRVLAPRFASANESCDNRKTIAEKKVIVIGDSSVPTTYPLQILEENDPRVWYKGTMGEDDWDDSFSPNLRITRVRIRQGMPTRDTSTGRYKLDEVTAKSVRPSRIVLFPRYVTGQSVFDNDLNRCYADASEDGDIDLSRCRLVSGSNCGPNDPTCVMLANPTFLQSQPADRLTWFVEFDSVQDSPSLGAGEVLAIEFTIEKL